MTVIKTVIEKQYPPFIWLQDCEDVELKGKTFKHAIEQSIKRQAVIDACNVDKSSLREWVKEQELFTD